MIILYNLNKHSRMTIQIYCIVCGYNIFWMLGSAYSHYEIDANNLQEPRCSISCFSFKKK